MRLVRKSVLSMFSISGSIYPKKIRISFKIHILNHLQNLQNLLHSNACMVRDSSMVRDILNSFKKNNFLVNVTKKWSIRYHSPLMLVWYEIVHCIKEKKVDFFVRNVWINRMMTIICLYQTNVLLSIS